ncbi:PREDICTED: diacylglycerol O-acyltransferase 1 isoform X2 [Nelumbo nucifera]|uniref:O-acyltransferase n=1 Tax=Nelumbo nucifera TaxID=4432 RepID=A0A1U7YQC8_NELNU|nr:PREDICTED: diacylglycerol O-acyltransferase 1 isoform X2 [Nelumbo nucifera]
MATPSSPDNLDEKSTLQCESDIKFSVRRRTTANTLKTAASDSFSKTYVSEIDSLVKESSTDSGTVTTSDEEVNRIGKDDDGRKDEANSSSNGEDRRHGPNVVVKFAYRASTPAHHRVKESPLSSDAIFKQSHAGLFNLCIVVLVAVNSRLIIENLMKYGLLMRSGFWFSSKSLSDWPLLMCCLTLPIFALAAFVVEKLAEHRFISELVVVLLHVLTTTASIIYPIYVILRCDSAVQSGITLMFFASIVWLKLVSYAHTNHDIRALTRPDAKGDVSLNFSNVDCSYNVSFKSLAYFMVAPTLCYQPSYPRTTCIRKGWVIRQLVKLVIFTGVMGFIIEQYINPIIQNSQHPLKGNLLYAIERVLKLSVPTLLNILAELLCFGDREFYKDWWNAKTIEEYWRMWNMPVHKWMVRHVYFPCIRHGLPRGVSIVIAFFISAVFHELLIGVPCRMLKFWAFIGIMFQVPLVIITNYLQKKFRNTMVGNMIFWFFFSILGQPMCVLLYYHDLMNRKMTTQ